MLSRVQTDLNIDWAVALGFSSKFWVYFLRDEVYGLCSIQYAPGPGVLI